jgi:tripartite-type tricarboxylate transporter receptor subunit TctC
MVLVDNATTIFTETGSGRRTMNRRRGILALLTAAVAALSLGMGCTHAIAQAYPSKPIKLIVPFPAGGSSDLFARTIARKMVDGLGQQIVVENRPGAGGTIGVEATSKSAPDGYTIAWGTVSALALAPVVYPALGYDPNKSLAPIGMAVSAPFLVVVNQSTPVNSLKELIDYAKAKPGALNFASVGNGSLSHFAGEHFKALAGVNIVHVPYKGVAPAVVDLLGGQVQIMFDQLASFRLQMFQSGKFRALAVAGPVRLPQLPSVPTAAEAGLPGFEVTSWAGLIAPGGTPAEIIRRLNAELQAALVTKEMVELTQAQGLETSGGSPERFAAAIHNEISTWSRVAKASGFKMD